MTAADMLASVPFLATVAAFIWALRLEGRVNTHEAVCAERYKKLEERHATSMEHLRAIDAKLDRLVKDV